MIFKVARLGFPSVRSEAQPVPADRIRSAAFQTLIDDMVGQLNQNDGRLSAAVLAIVRSPQFRSIRGSEYAGND